MSNVKDVGIKGCLPFDCAQNEAMCKILGQLDSPTIGLRITWSSNPIDHVSNEHGGKTAVYGFMIKGQEAVS